MPEKHELSEAKWSASLLQLTFFIVYVLSAAARSSRRNGVIAEYQTQLPDKALLQAKLHEFYLQNAPEDNPVM